MGRPWGVAREDVGSRDAAVKPSGFTAILTHYVSGLVTHTKRELLELNP